MSLTLDPAKLAQQQADEAADYYQVGQAFGMLTKEGATPAAAPVLHGRLIVTPANWGMITVPNSLIRGLFDAMDETGIELPLRDGVLKGHISVFRPEEIDKIGGPDKISERGHPFTYQLGPIMSVEPKGWPEMSKAWFVKVLSPELKALRRSYGLTPLPNGDHEFHCTIAVRRKNVLNQGPVSKAAAVKTAMNDDYAWGFRPIAERIAYLERQPDYPRKAAQIEALRRDQVKAAADDEDVHSDQDKDVHSDENNDDDGDKKTIKIPLVMRRIVMTTLSFGKPGDSEDDDGIEDFMNRLRERAGKAGEKQAANYVFHGDVQGVGLRKALHTILEERGRPGLAYNDARANQTLVSLPGRARSHAPLFRALGEHLKRRGADYSFTSAPGREQHHPHTMTDEEVAAFVKRQGLDVLGSKSFDEQRKWVADRYRLKDTPEGHLAGHLPPLAIAQLKVEEPIYSKQLETGGGYGPGPWRTKEAGGGDIFRRFGRSLSAARPALAGLGQQVGSVAKPAFRAAGKKLYGLPRFVARVPEGRSVASTPGDALRSAANAYFRPRYPLLDRPLGVKSMPRVLDRTRAWAGTGLRGGSLLSMSLSAPTIANAALRAYPNTVGSWTAALAGRTQDMEQAKAQMRAEAPGFYGNLAHDAVAGASNWAMDNPVGRFIGRNLAKVSPDAIFDRLPTLQPRTDPTSQFTHGVVGDIALPIVRHDIYQARKNRPGMMGTIDALRSTTPFGWTMTKGLQALGSPKAPDLRGAVAKHLPAFLAKTNADPAALTAGPYGNVAKQLASTVDISKGNPNVAAANWAMLSGRPREQAEKLRKAFPDRLTPTMGDIWQGARNAPQNIKQRVEGIRRLLPGAAEKEGAARRGRAVTALAKLTTEKQADTNQVLAPALVGAGVGGLGGWGLGRLLHSEHPWRDALYGAGVGSLLGVNYAGVKSVGAMPGREEAERLLPTPIPEENTTRENLFENVKDYYKDVEGGPDEALREAVKNQQPMSAAIGAPVYTEKDVRTPIPITEVDVPDVPLGKAPNKGLMGVTTMRHDPRQIRIGLVGREDAARAGESFDQFKQHEGTHSATLALPLSRDRLSPGWDRKFHSGAALIKSLDPNADISELTEGGDYALGAAEFDPRLASIKRFYAKQHGKDVRTPEEARKAMEWYRDWIKTPEGRKAAGGQGRTWQSVFDSPWWRILEPAAARRMPGLVHNAPATSGMPVMPEVKVASLDKEAAPPWLRRAGSLFARAARYSTGAPKGEGYWGAKGQGVRRVTTGLFRRPAKFLTAPRLIPGLSRAASDPTSFNVFSPGTYKNFLAKSPDRGGKFERTRNVLGETIRLGGTAASALTGGLAAYNIHQNQGFEGSLGVGLGRAIGMSEEEQNVIREVAKEHMRGLRGPIATQLFGNNPLAQLIVGKPDTSAAGKMLGDIARDTVKPFLARDLYQSRQKYPRLMNFADYARLGSPVGMVMTGFSRNFANPDKPDVGAAIERAQAKYLPELRQDILPSLTSPAAQPILRTLTDPRVWPIVQKNPYLNSLLDEASKSPEARALLAKATGNPRLMNLAGGMVSSPEVQAQIKAQAASGVHGQARKLLGLGPVGGGAATGGEQSGPSGLIGKALPAAQEGLGAGLRESWADPEIRGRVTGLGLAAGAGGVGGGVLGHLLGSAISPDKERLSYADRRARESHRSWMRNLGILGGGIGTPLLANYLMQPKKAAAMPDSMQAVAMGA
jgi:hypothetical protein